MTKTKIYLAVAIFLFVSAFFVGAQVVKADDCSDCMTAYTEEECISQEYCASYGTGAVDMCNGSSGTQYCCENYGGYWYDNACNASPTDLYGNSTSFDNYDPDSNSAADNYEYTMDTSKSSSTCDSDPSCWFWNCCGSSTSSAPAQTPEQVARANADATAAIAGRNTAMQQLNTANSSIIGACSNPSSPECEAAKAKAVAADVAFRAADAELTAAMYAAANGGASSSDAIPGLVISGNGMLGQECRDSEGNYSANCPSYAIPGYAGGISSGGGLPLGNVAGISGATTPKCGSGFQEIGGVCFPTNTGLSNASIYVILSNIFSWLIGLFTTFAVIAFVISGIQYLMASGDEGMAETAKHNATNAIIGIIVGLSGFIILKAVSAALSGQSYFF